MVTKTAIIVKKEQWGCSPLSTVRLNKDTNAVINNEFNYYPAFNDNNNVFKNSVDFRLIKKISPMIEFPRGRSSVRKLVNLLEIISLSSVTNGLSNTDLGRNFLNMENKVISSVVHSLYSSDYSQANSTQKRSVLASARTAQSLVDAIYAQRKVLLGKLFKYYMDCCMQQPQVRVVQARPIDLRVTFKVFSISSGSSSGSSKYAGLGTVGTTQSSRAITFNELSANEKASLKGQIESIWSSCYKPPVKNANPQTSCHFSVKPNGSALEEGDFLIAASSSALLRSRFLSGIPNLAKINSASIKNARLNSAPSQNFTLGLFNNLSDVLPRYPQELGKGNVLYRVIRSQLQNNDVTQIARFLNAPSMSYKLTVRGLQAKRGSLCVETRIQEFLSALFLVDFMLRSQNAEQHQFDAHTLRFLSSWLPTRASVVASSTRQTTQTAVSAGFPSGGVRIPTQISTSTPTGRLPTGSLSQIQQIRPIGQQTQLPAFRPTVIPQLSPTTSLTPTPTPFFPQIPQTPVASEETVSPLDEQQLLEQQLLEQQLLEQQLLEQQLLEQQLAESQVTSEGETQVTEGEADKKESSKLPYIIGGVVLVGAIGFYVVSRKNK